MGLSSPHVTVEAMTTAASMHVLIITDAWSPQVNGVVRTLQTTQHQLERLGHRVTVIGPDRFWTVPCPGYGEIRLSVHVRRKLWSMLDRAARQGIDCVHIATEGPLGWGARGWCLKRQIAYTTSCHTRFPEYIRLRAPIPLKWSYAWLHRFHSPATRTLVRSQSQWDALSQRGFEHLAIWPGGVDTELFQPRPKRHEFPGPVAMYVGRVAAEKSIEDFLAAPFEGSQVVVGDGPSRAALQAKYPNAIFTGFRHGQALAQALNEADVFVFPSKTDTLGLVMLEAMACGVPVAAYPVCGPKDVVQPGHTGILHDDLAQAMRQAQHLDGHACRQYAEQFSWMASTQRFLTLLQPLDSPVSEPATTPATSRAESSQTPQLGERIPLTPQPTIDQLLDHPRIGER